jgi:hypothetical protein
LFLCPRPARAFFEFSSCSKGLQEHFSNPFRLFSGMGKALCTHAFPLFVPCLAAVTRQSKWLEFPIFCGVVFWQDFEQGRKQQNGLSNIAHERHAKPTQPGAVVSLPPRPAKILLAA